MTRTSTFSGWVPPIGTTSRSCSARSSLAWSPSGISAISSSSKVPPLAARKKPCPPDDAPVNEPLWWPNSIASSIVSGSAAQLIATNGPSRRDEPMWIALASTSLPVPVGPLISTVMSERRRARPAPAARGSRDRRRPAHRARAPSRWRSRRRSRHLRCHRTSGRGCRRGTGSPCNRLRRGSACGPAAGGTSPSAIRNRSCAPGLPSSHDPIAKPCARSAETSAYFCRSTAAEGTIDRMCDPLLCRPFAQLVNAP
jgi:hypothetical protein